jgi:hypothetical protein
VPVANWVRQCRREFGRLVHPKLIHKVVESSRPAFFPFPVHLAFHARCNFCRRTIVFVLRVRPLFARKLRYAPSKWRFYTYSVAAPESSDHRHAIPVPELRPSSPAPNVPPSQLAGSHGAEVTAGPRQLGTKATWQAGSPRRVVLVEPRAASTSLSVCSTRVQGERGVCSHVVPTRDRLQGQCRVASSRQSSCCGWRAAAAAAGDGRAVSTRAAGRELSGTSCCDARPSAGCVAAQHLWRSCSSRPPIAFHQRAACLCLSAAHSRCAC